MMRKGRFPDINLSPQVLVDCVTVCVYVCVCMYVYLYTYVYVCVHMYMCMHACVFVCVYICVCMYMCLYVCMHVCLYVYMYMFICTCVCMCIYSSIPQHYALQVYKRGSYSTVHIAKRLIVKYIHHQTLCIHCEVLLLQSIFPICQLFCCS